MLTASGSVASGDQHDQPSVVLGILGEAHAPTEFKGPPDEFSGLHPMVACEQQLCHADSRIRRAALGRSGLLVNDKRPTALRPVPAAPARPRSVDMRHFWL
jgi:hypothetical protein